MHFASKALRQGRWPKRIWQILKKKNKRTKNPRNPTVFGFIALTLLSEVPVNRVKESARLQVS